MLQKCDSWKMLELVFKFPTKRFHLRELSRLLKWGPGRVERHMKGLIKLGLITENIEKNLKIFKADKESEEFKQLKKCYNLLSIREAVDFINEELGFPQAIILYGAAVHGEDTETSDIDLFIVGKEKEMDLSKFEKKLNRKIHLMFAKNIEQLKKSPRLLNNLINGIVVSGYLKVIE